jgi:hypothetical protein
MTAEQNQRCIVRGLYYRLRPDYSVVLLATSPGVQGDFLVCESYEVTGADEPSAPQSTGRGGLTQSGRFFMAAVRYKRGETEAEKVKIYQYIEGKSWQAQGFYTLVDAWREEREEQKVYVFRLKKQKEAISH